MTLSPPAALLIQSNFCLFPTVIVFLFYRADKFHYFNGIYHRFLCEFSRILLRKVWDPRFSKSRGSCVRVFHDPCSSLLMSLTWMQVQLLRVPCAWHRRALPPLAMSLQAESQRVQVQEKINWWETHSGKLLEEFLEGWVTNNRRKSSKIQTNITRYLHVPGTDKWERNLLFIFLFFFPAISATSPGCCWGSWQCIT